MMEELAALMSQDIPEGRQSIKDSHTNLEKVAEYCEANYFQADNKTQALEESKRYTTQSLASVAYQINTLAFNLLHLLDLHTSHLSSVESQVNHIAQTVSIHKEKVARREIGVLTTNKNTIRQHKILAPANQEKPIKYVRKPIDYTILDNVGHTASRQQMISINYSQTAPRPRRSSSSSSAAGPGPAGPAPTQKPPTPPTQQPAQMSMNQMNVSGGTLRRVDYRTPPAIAPPQLPNTYASNYPTAAPNVRRNNSLCSTLPAAVHTSHLMHQQSQQTTHYRPGILITPGHQQQQPQQQHQSSILDPQTLNSITGPCNGSQTQHQNRQLSGDPSNLQESLPAPPPTMMVHANQPNSTAIPVAAVTHSAGNVSPPLPPPPEELSSPSLPPPPPTQSSTIDSPSAPSSKNRILADPAWAPTSYLEKVVAVYDYQADKTDELSFSENAIIYVIKKNDDGWFEGVMNGVQGLFPGNYVEPSV